MKHFYRALLFIPQLFMLLTTYIQVSSKMSLFIAPPVSASAEHRSHIPTHPKSAFYLRHIQFLVAIAIIGLAAYIISYSAYSGASLSLFTALVTLIIAPYNILTITACRLTYLYNYWAVLGLDVFALVFWLISFGLLASEAAVWNVFDHYYDRLCIYGYFYKRSAPLIERGSNYRSYRNAMAAGAGLGGLEFVLFAIALVFTGSAILRHHKAGSHCIPHPGTDHVATEQRGVQRPAPVQQDQTQAIPLQS